MEGSASDQATSACLQSPESLNLTTSPPLHTHNYPTSAIQNNNRILEPTSSQPEVIDDINTAITTTNITPRSPIPHQPGASHRTDCARLQ